MKRINQNIFIGIIMLVISGVIYVSSMNYPDKSKLFPNFIATVICISSILMIFKAIKQKGLFVDMKWNAVLNKEFSMLFVSTAIFIFSMPRLGFYASTFLYITAVLYVMNVAKLKALSISIGMCIFSFVFFEFLLGLPFPRGILL